MKALVTGASSGKAQEIADYFVEIDVENAKLLEIKEMDQCIKIGYDTIMKNKEKNIRVSEVNCK